MNFPIQIKSELYKNAKIAAARDGRTVSQQVQYWAKVGKACIENPDLPVNFIIDSLESLKTKDDETELFIRV